MGKFTQADYHSMLGVTSISQVSDEVIWQNLLSPITRALLGPIVKARSPAVLESIKGLFDGDEASNLNDHKLYGGQDGFVRFPYVVNVYETRYGLFIVKRDLRKFEVFAWIGNVLKGHGEMIFKAGLRDRRFDGSKSANDSALLDYTYDDPLLHQPLSRELNSVEFSIYAFMPGSRIIDVCGDQNYEDFVRQPFALIKDPDQFLKYFNMVWKSNRAPGQYAVTIPDVSSVVLRGFKKIAQDAGYDLLEMAPSHYHVARWGLNGGYGFAYKVQKDAFNALKKGVEKLRSKGIHLSRSQQSWVVVLQSLAQDRIPAELNLGGAVWPQDNISDQCLWLYRSLSKQAHDFVPECFNHDLKTPCRSAD